MKNECVRCGAELTIGAQYQCCRCFTKYCQKCENSNEGRSCPQCGMGARLIIPTDKPAEK